MLPNEAISFCFNQCDRQISIAALIHQSINSKLVYLIQTLANKQE